MNCPPAPLTPPDPAASPLAALRREGETLLVYAGGFTPNRGLENVVRAMSLLEGFRLVMVGWGPLEHELRSLASDRVVFLDPVEPDAVVATVAGADIGLVPYLPIGRNNELAAPNKLFEYLHAGLAVAASDLPDIRNVLEDKDVGAVFDASSPESIARVLTRLVPRLGELKRNARASATAYSWESEERVLFGIYASLLNAAGAPDDRSKS
jgi:glycosyltransferase involved in cell wall biosynthesis